MSFSPATSLSVQIAAHGGPEVMQLQEVALGRPGPRQVRVRHTAIGVNFIDIYQRTGLYPVGDFPSGLGQEAAGVVEELGAEVTEFALGDRVAYAGGRPGAYSSSRVLDVAALVPIPPEVSDEDAAACLLKGMTVEYLVQRTYSVQVGDTVLWHAAAGGVGVLACQWLRHLGATVIATASSAEKLEQAQLNGATHLINYAEQDFVTEVKRLTHGRGVQVVYDSVGARTVEGSLSCLAPRGLLVSFGNASGKPPALDLLRLAALGSLYVTRPTLAAYTATREELLGSARAVFALMAQRVLRASIGSRLPLTHVADAHRALEERRTRGSTVLVP